MCNVNIATGEVTHFKYDVLLSGRIPLKLARAYSSYKTSSGLLGVGWTLTLGTWLQVTQGELELFVDGESVATLPAPSIGQQPLEAGSFRIQRTRSEIVVTDRLLNRYIFPHQRELLPERLNCGSFRDYFGNSLEYEYDQDRLVTLIDSFQRRLGFTYDQVSRLTAIWLHPTRSRAMRHEFVRYEFDNNDDLISVCDAMGNATRYRYAAHLLTQITNPNGRDLYYAYNRQKKCVRTWFVGGEWDRQLRYDDKLARVLVTDPYGHSTLYKHNGKGVIIGEVDALGRVREDVVDDHGRLLFRSGTGGGVQAVISRDPGTREILLSQNGTETHCLLDANDRVTRMEDHDGNVWQYEYDPIGNDLRTEGPNGAVWSFDYNSQGDIVGALDPCGFERFREFSPNRLVLRDRFGIRLDERYDELGRAVQYLDGCGGELRMEYDPCGRPLRRIHADGTYSAIEYDPSGLPTAVINELGERMQLVRNLSGTSLTFRRPDGYTESFEYGLIDEFKRITNSKGETAELLYDIEGRCTSISYFDGRRHGIAYDEADHPIALTDGLSGQVLAECEYENDDLVRESYGDGRSLTVSYGPAGELVTLENDDATLLVQRNAQMRITTIQSDTVKLNYDYNLCGDCTSVRVNGGRKIDYDWDGRQRLVRMSDTSSGTYAYTHDARDLVTTIQMPNGCLQTFEYDVFHRMVYRQVSGADGALICSRRYTYDPIGRLSRYEDSSRGTRTFAYTPMDFLTSVSDNGQTDRLQHDSNGNQVLNQAGETIAYAAGDRATQVGNDQLEYDASGRLVTWRTLRGDSHFEYTGEGWLKRAYLNNGVTAEYWYDGKARRIAKSVDGIRTEYAWNGVHLLSESTGGEQIDYLFMPGSFFLAGLTTAGRHYSFVFDQLGTPTELIDDQGQIAWAADYSVYGEILRFRANSVNQPFRFLGQYFDDELGWHYNWHRYYQPRLGRFTCPDPLGFAAGLNLYAYAPNPTNWVDPLGLAFAVPGTPATCEVLSKCSWGNDMMKEAQKKTEGMNDAGCSFEMNTECERPPDQKDYYMKNCVEAADKKKVETALADQGDSCKSKQVDHIKEVQCGGENDCKNLSPLTQTVNASFGSQIKQCRAQLTTPNGTGTVSMVIKLVDIRKVSMAGLKKHGTNKKPCEPGQAPRCP